MVSYISSCFPHLNLANAVVPLMMGPHDGQYLHQQCPVTPALVPMVSHDQKVISHIVLVILT